MSTIDRKYECPYLAGYSKDGQTIYIDKRLPRILKLKDGRTMNVDKYLKVHEDTEKHLEDTKGYKYQYAHEQATGAERQAVEADGYPWDEYEAYMLREVKKLTGLDSKTPPDIDLKPEHDYHDNKMATKVESLQKGGIAKPSQAPNMPEGKQVAQIEDHKQDLDWKTKNVTLHKANPVHAATGKMAQMIRQVRSGQLQKTREPVDLANDGIRPPSKTSAAHTQTNVPGENDNSPLTKYNVTDPVVADKWASRPVSKDPKWHNHAATYRLANGLYHHHFKAKGKNSPLSDAHIISENPDPWANGSSIVEGEQTQEGFRAHNQRSAPEAAGKGHGKLALQVAAAVHGNLVGSHNVSEKATKAWASMPKMTNGNIDVKYGQPGVAGSFHTGTVKDPVALNTQLYGVAKPKNIKVRKPKIMQPLAASIDPLEKAIVPEGNRDEAHDTSRERKGNKDLNAKQPTPLKGNGARPPQGKPGAPEQPLRKNMPIAVSTVAVIHGDHILMGRRRDTKKLVMPGGHADPGEHPEQTARRELYEEAGINAKELKFLGSEDVVSRDGKIRRINCFITFGHFHPTNVHDPDQEIEEWLWVPAVQYAASGTADALHDDIAEQLHDRKNNIMLKLLGIAH